MKELTRAIKEKARQQGADLVGIASIDRFDGVPQAHHPSAVFPEAKSVIVIGRRILRGSLRGMEEGTNLVDYPNYGHHWLTAMFIPLTVYRSVQFIEDQGWEAVPLYPYPPEVAPEGIPTAEGRPAPNVTIDFNYAAVAAGLGELGYADVVLTPEYGHRQRFHIILTDAELEADPLFEGKLCGMCMQCRDICPFGALSGERTVTVAGRSYTVGNFDEQICKSCRNGAGPSAFHADGHADRLGAVCMRTCMDQLERNGKLEKSFATSFRSREPWVRDHLGKAQKAPVQRERKGCTDEGKNNERGR